MNSSERASQALEWNRFLDLATREARTERGKSILHSLESTLEWAQDVAAARVRQQETQEASQLLDRDGLWGPLSELPDPEPVLERLSRGSVLEVVEMGLLRRWLYATDSWVQTPRDEIRGDLFKKALTRLPDPFEPLRILDKLLTPEGELSERASPRLTALFTEIRTLKREIGSTLDHLMKTFSQKGVLQENFTDLRDGRYVLPIKISSQNDVDGIIYEASASRQTVFVEPREVAPLNNRLRQRQNDLMQEIFVVLEEASKRLQPFAGEIQLAVSILAHWDAVQGRARLGRKFSGKAIQVSEERNFRMEQTAHPLLWWALSPEAIIRNEIDFGDPVRTLLLTGPNTGGKTVLLKTLGLAALCARTGFPFPATDQPIVPFFQSVFADLGDPQSIEAHLSSFSGHLMRFNDTLENVTDQSLVLIDELNSATDPEEGAALGRAFLETIMERGAIVVTTTHDPHLKAMAISDERILNASMQFDENARSPTYRIALGVPGRSRALETAERLGIPMSVIELARRYLSAEHLEFEKMLSKLESDAHEAARARREAVILREEAERLKKEWTERTESSVNEMLDRTRHKLRRILEQAQDDVRSTVKKLDEAKHRKELDSARGQISGAYGAASDLIEKALHEEAPEVAQALSLKKKEVPTQEKPPIEVGAIVRIPKWKNTGTVLSLTGNKVKVAMGTLQMTLSMDEIELIPGAHKAKPKAHVSTGGAAETPASIDLRGVRLDEAMSQLETYLDAAYRSGLVEVTVIHGLGTGAIREGARRLISKLPYVRACRDGGAGQGGAGATLVEFERE